MLNRKSDCTPKHFEAEIMVKLPKSRLPFVVKKKNKDFRTVLSDAADTMETALERDHEKSERSRKVIGQSHFPVWKAKQAATLPKKK